MIKFLRLLCIVTVGLCIGLGFYGKSQFKHINYQEYLNQSLYYQSNLVNSNHQVFNKSEDITNLSDLMEKSSHVLKVRVTPEVLLKDNAIINECQVLEVLKSPNISANQTVKIYQSIEHWSLQMTNFAGKSMPLKIDEEYYVFLNNANNQSGNAYYYSSLEFSHFNLNKEFKTLDNYQNNLTIEEVYNYNCINYTEQNLVKYKNIMNELQNLSS